MQSVNDISNDNNTALVPADQLRAMTVSKADLYKRQKASVLDSLMSSMVQLATENGNSEYQANLHPQFDATMLGEIKTELEGLGYTVTSEAVTGEKIGAFISLTVKW